jgi:hypothetical protein
MTRPTMDDPFDRRLRGFLDWQAEQLAGAPSANEITARLAEEAEDRFGSRFGSRVGSRLARWRAARQTARIAWAFLILALLAAMAVAVAVIGSRDHRTSVVLPTGSPTPAPTAVAATAVVPTPTIPCPSPAELIPARPVGGPGTAPSANFLVAYLSNDDSDVRIAGGGLAGPSVVATIGSADATNTSEVLGWSTDGSTILVHLRNFSARAGPERNCGDLWLVRSDGSAATKLTGNDPGEDASAAVLAGSGRSVAYLSGQDLPGSAVELRLADASGATTVLATAPCSGTRDLLWPFGRGRLAWSPDGTRLAILCTGSSVTVYSVADGTSRDFTLPRQTLAESMAWSADGGLLEVAAVPYGSGNNQGPLTLLVIDFDPRADAARVVSRSSVEVEWIIGEDDVDAFSPDGRWFIASGGTPGAVPGVNFTSTWYVIEVATGLARQVFDKDEPCPCAEWLPDSSGLVYLDPLHENALVQAGLDGKTVATLGSLERWGVWHWLSP